MDIRYHITSHRVVMIELKEGMFRVVKRIIGQSSIDSGSIYCIRGIKHGSDSQQLNKPNHNT